MQPIENYPHSRNKMIPRFFRFAKYQRLDNNDNTSSGRLFFIKPRNRTETAVTIDPLDVDLMWFDRNYSRSPFEQDGPSNTAEVVEEEEGLDTEEWQRWETVLAGVMLGLFAVLVVMTLFATFLILAAGENDELAKAIDTMGRSVVRMR